MTSSQNTLEIEISGPANGVARFIQKIPKDYIVAIYSQEGTLQSDTMNITLKLSVSPAINGMGEIQQNQVSGSWDGIWRDSGKKHFPNYNKEKTQG